MEFFRSQQRRQDDFCMSARFDRIFLFSTEKRSGRGNVGQWPSMRGIVQPDAAAEHPPSRTPLAEVDVVEDSVLPDGRAVSDGWCVIGAAFGQAAWLSSGGRSEASGETIGKPVQKTNEGDVRRNRIWKTGRKFLTKRKETAQPTCSWLESISETSGKQLHGALALRIED